MSVQNCPCGRNNLYEDCCKKAHNDILSVKTAENLMRSRYTAFTQANVDYLLKSWSKKTVDTSAKATKELKAWAQSVTWLKLEVLKSNLGKEKDLEGTVEFKAFFMENSQVECIHENSFFKKENGHWVYTSDSN